MTYLCEKCGLCCQNLLNSDLYDHLHNGNGTCIHFDQATKLCSIYDERPIICRVDEYYEHYLKAILAREEYYKMNLIACNVMQNEKNK